MLEPGVEVSKRGTSDRSVKDIGWYVTGPSHAAHEYVGIAKSSAKLALCRV